ncbi:META domain-containing protein [Microbulbifer guangxiensis]|uniref:META domain-containing protein n=1 Tax=Microbulbifer guangxiensis TaxID=2904249 RepID=UPI001F301197|nr:META domain-containing protein [Microbulbifer guangxiensis]
MMDDAPNEVPVAEQSVCDHQWLLKRMSIDGREHRSRLLWQTFLRDRPYFTCDDLGYVRGSAGNNPYLGRFSLQEDGRINWSQIPEISRMGNVRESSELEQDYLRALPLTDSLNVEGDALILQDEGGMTRLEFRRTDNPPPPAP